MTLLDLITGLWAIEADKLREIQAIYATHLRGDKIDVAAIEARLGRPLASEQQDYSIQPGGIAVLRLQGIMAPKANLLMQVSGGISTQMATRQLESAAADPRVRATVLAIDSPGGSVLGTPEMADAVRELAAVKPIVAHSDGALASAAYWVGSAANAVFLSGPTVLAGSIGILVDRSYNPSSPIKTESIVAGRYKRLAHANEPLSDEARAVLQADADYVYTLFVDAVARQRGVSSEQVLEHMADGRVFRGQQAIDAGLVDGVSTLDALVESMATDPARYSTRRRPSLPASLPKGERRQMPPLSTSGEGRGGEAAVFAVAAHPSPSAGVAPKDEPTPVKGKQMSAEDKTTPLTRASLETEHAAVFAQVRTEFTALGAAQERDRIQAVLAVGEGLPGHEKLLATLAFDGKTSAADASLAVLAAERQARAAAAAAHAADAPQPARPSAPAAQGDQPTPATAAQGMVALYNQTHGVK